jgi:tetratricopeptide (TPR) repeat protein
MFTKKIFIRRSLTLSILFFVACMGIGRSQNDAVEDIKYNDDYERIQKIVAGTQPLKRADQFVALYKERPDMDQKLRMYVDSRFIMDLDALSKQKNFLAIRGLSERAIKIRPNFGEAYMYYGLALKQNNQIDEAINAFAKCFVIPNSYQQRAKPILESTYRAKNGGSMVGLDKLLAAIKKEMKIK